LRQATLNFKVPRFISGALYNDKKYTCIPAGRRTGKTYNAFQWQDEMALMTPNSAHLWVDTTQRNLTEYVEIYQKRILKDIWADLVRYDKQGHKLEFKNGSFIHMRSAERPENMEGFEYDTVVCNEAGIIFKKPELWTNTLMPMAKRAIVKIVGTPKGQNYYATLAANAATNPDWATHKFTVYDSPYWTDGEINTFKSDPSIPPDVWEQEYMAEFIVLTSNVICKRTFKESWRDDKDIHWTIKHTWIKQQLADDGYYFVSFDGGMHTTHSAAILGYHNKRYRRDILLKEFYNTNKSDSLREISMMVGEFSQAHQLPIEEFRLYGDPAIKTYGDDVFIEQVLNKKPNLLHSMNESTNTEIVAAFRNRKTKRLTVLNTEIFSLRSDNKPAIIILRDTNKLDPHDFGCPQTWQGLFNGQYKKEIKDIAGKSVLTEDLEQIPPVTDICDAYTYFLLAERPIYQGSDSSNIKLGVIG
jgi:hypothetical protein